MGHVSGEDADSGSHGGDLNVFHEGLVHLRQVNVVALDALNVGRDFFGFGGDKFGPQHLHGRLGEETQTLLVIGLIEDFEVDGPDVCVEWGDQLLHRRDQLLAPHYAVRAH